jgi:hypothetical protein
MPVGHLSGNRITSSEERYEMSWTKAIIKQAFRDAKSLTDSARGTAQAVQSTEQGRRALKVARVAATSGPVKELATICGRAGAAGAMVDGAMGGVAAVKAMREGRLDGKGAAIHVGAEAGCGFVTSASGTAGTVAIYMVTGSMGPAALAAGMGASMGSRWLYRKVVGETLPEKGKNVDKSDDDGNNGSEFEEIG